MKQYTPKAPTPKAPKVEAAMPTIVPGYTLPSLPVTPGNNKLYPESTMLHVEKILDLLVELGEDQAVRSSLGSLYEIGDRFYRALLDEIHRDLPRHRGGPVTETDMQEVG